MNLDFIQAMNKIMEHRSGKLLIEVRTDFLTSKELLEAQYDSKKIEFDPIRKYKGSISFTATFFFFYFLIFGAIQSSSGTVGVSFMIYFLL